MAIEFSLRIKDDILNETILVNKINQIFNCNLINIKNQNDNIAIFDEFYEEKGFLITFIKKKKVPYNFYDSNFIEKEFEYCQVISFDCDKTKELSSTYNLILEFILSLYQDNNMEALLTSDFSEDICYFLQGSIVYFNSAITFLDVDNMVNNKNIQVKFVNKVT